MLDAKPPSDTLATDDVALLELGCLTHCAGLSATCTRRAQGDLAKHSAMMPAPISNECRSTNEKSAVLDEEMRLAIKRQRALLTNLDQFVFTQLKDEPAKMLLAHLQQTLTIMSELLDTMLVSRQGEADTKTSIADHLHSGPPENGENCAVVVWKGSAEVLDLQAEAFRQLQRLTPRQFQVMDLVLAGHPSKNIAVDLHISRRTVENHRASIMKKTGAASLPALARLAFVASGSLTNA